MTVEKDLLVETEKWLIKIKTERKKIVLADEKRATMLKNIDAYISDTDHFLKKNDLIRAFEAVVWAWAWIEILEQLDVIRKRK
jgi:uncharacterized protein